MIVVFVRDCRVPVSAARYSQFILLRFPHDCRASATIECHDYLLTAVCLATCKIEADDSTFTDAVVYCQLAAGHRSGPLTAQQCRAALPHGHNNTMALWHCGMQNKPKANGAGE